MKEHAERKSNGSFEVENQKDNTHAAQMITDRDANREFPGIKRKSKEKKLNPDKFEAFNEVSLNSKIGLFEKSQNSTVKDLQRKLD